jgi:predicted RNA-binding Zn-ribbon protein involved in translation (DUF1610 family)
MQKQKGVFESSRSQAATPSISLSDLRQHPLRCDECGDPVILALEDGHYSKREYVCSTCGLVQPPSIQLFVDFEESDFADLTPRLIPMPPRCICGNRKYTITRERKWILDHWIHVRIVAQCTRNPLCGYKRYWYPGSSQWTDVHQGYKVKGHRRPRKLPHVFRGKPSAGAGSASDLSSYHDATERVNEK